MENVKIISDNGTEINVNGLFYIFNSKYYFMYTMGEIDENEYVKLYVVQVCKEVQNTPTGPIDTGYMLGMEISDKEEWKNVQESITKIVEDKKNGVQSPEIQYLPMNMLVNLKIVSKNKFKLMKYIVEENFKVTLTSNVVENETTSEISNLALNAENSFENELVQPIDVVNPVLNDDIQNNEIVDGTANIENSGEVIIDYRARFFEEQEKNQALEEQIRILNEKLENIKSIIG